MDGQVSLFVFYRISVFVSHVFYGFGDLLHQKSYYLCILKLNSTRIPYLTFQPKTPSRAFDCGIDYAKDLAAVQS